MLMMRGVDVQNARVEGQQSLLKPTYAKQRAAATGPVPTAVEVQSAIHHCITH